MPYTERFTEVHHVDAGELHADSYAVGTFGTSWLSMRDYHRAIFLIDVGDMVAGATLEAKIEQATDTNGAGVKDVTGKTITQLTQAGGDGNQRVVIELRSEELDVDGGFDCIRGWVYVGGAAIELCGILLRTIPRFAPVGVTQLAEVID